MPELVADLVRKPIKLFRRHATGDNRRLGLTSDLLNVAQRCPSPLLVPRFDEHNIKLLLFVERESGGLRQSRSHRNGQAANRGKIFFHR